MKYRIDVMRFREGRMTLNGWAIPKDGREDSLRFSVLKQEGGSLLELPFQYVPMLREDVAAALHANPMCGFDIQFDYERGASYLLRMEDQNGKRIGVRINESVIAKRDSVAHRKRERLLALCNMETVTVALDYLKENGLRALWKKSVHKLRGIQEDYDYPEWYEKTRPKEAELSAQAEPFLELKKRVMEEGVFLPVEDNAASSEGASPKESWKRPFPSFSIVVPAYNTPEKYLRMLFSSLEQQTYPNFELILADGSEPENRIVERVMKEYMERDKRFRYEALSENLGISENTNAALQLAKGDYIVLCDHDDEFSPDALYSVREAILAHPDAEFLYTDEDKVDFDGKALFEPHFKPDYDPDLLRTVNYICHLSVIRKDLLRRVMALHPAGLAFDPAYDGAQDYDFFLRCTEEATKTERKELLFWHRQRRSEEQGSEDIGTWKASVPDLQNSSLVERPEELDGQASAEGRKEAEGKLSERASAEGGSPAGISEAMRRKLLEGRFTSEHVIHIPHVCYHWRCHKNSTSANPESKLYAFSAGKRAVLAHEKRLGIAVENVVDGVTYGFYHTIFPRTEERVSVVIPNKDHIADLDQCIRSLLQRSMHRNLELIIVENNSTDSETFSYYEKIEHNPAYFMTDFEAGYEALLLERKKREEYRRTSRITITDTYETPVDKAVLSDISKVDIRIVRWEREFNYSAINNFGVRAAAGEYLLFLNNDVALINPGTITEMLGYLKRPDVGIVGARLLYEDNTVQHAGVVVGFGGIAGGAFIGTHERENSYMHRMMCAQDYSAVTAACLMTKKELFLAVGGFTEELAVAFNDIDFCMKIRREGRLCVYAPYALLHHYESKSRGLEDTPEKVKRFNNEIAVFASRWPAILKEGDPYYNPNLTLRKSNFALRDLSKEKPGEPYQLELDVEKQLREVEKAKRLHP